MRGKQELKGRQMCRGGIHDWKKKRKSIKTKRRGNKKFRWRNIWHNRVCVWKGELQAKWKSPCEVTVHWATLSVCPHELWQSSAKTSLLHTHMHFTFLFLTLPLSFFFLSGTESCASPRKVIIKYAADPLLFWVLLRPLSSLCVCNVHMGMSCKWQTLALLSDFSVKQTILPAPPSSVCFCTCRFFYRSWLQLIKTSVFKEIKFSSVTTPVLLLAIIKAQSFLNHLPPLAVLESFVCNQQKDGSLTLFKNMQVLLQFYFTYLLFVTVNIQNIFK